MSTMRTRAPAPRPQLRAADLAQPDTISPGDAARALGVSVATLASWADAGRLTARLSPGGRRTYLRAEITALAAPQRADPAEVERVSVRVHNLRVASAMTEAVLQQHVRTMADRLGWLGYHTHRSDRSDPGWPDLVLARRGVVLYRELKTERGKLSGPQERWLEALGEAGHDVGVWRPLDLLERRVEKTLLGLS